MPSISRGPRKLLLLAGIAALAVTAAASAESSKVFLYNYDGQPLLIRKGKPVKLGVDVELFKGDRVEVDGQGSIEITAHYFGGVRISAGGSARVIDTSRDHFHLLVEKGDFLVNLKHLDAGLDFTVSTPHAAAIARFPTQFSGKIDPPGVPNPGTHIAVRKGVLDCKILESSASMRLQETMAVDVLADSYIPSPRTVTAEEELVLRVVNTVPVIELPKDDF